MNSEVLPALPAGYEKWAKKLRAAADQFRSSGWLVGDLLIEGEQKYGEMYAQAADETGFSPQTLMNMKWVASVIKPSWRQENLSFSVHMELARLPEAKVEKALDVAARHNWNSGETRKRVSAFRKGEDKALQVSWEPPLPVSDDTGKGGGAADTPTGSAAPPMVYGGDIPKGKSREEEIADVMSRLVGLIIGTTPQGVFHDLEGARHDQFETDADALQFWLDDHKPKGSKNGKKAKA
jgi:hypothetical protein